MSNCVLDSLLVVIMISDDLCERSTNECINKFCTKFYNVGKKNSMSVLEEYYNKLLKPEMQLGFNKLSSISIKYSNLHDKCICIYIACCKNMTRRSLNSKRK